MSNQQNPGSPADPNTPGRRSIPDDDDISLEDRDERPQQRQKLPDQRRELPSFEIGGSVTGAREEMPPPSFSPDLFESAKPAQSAGSAGAGGWEPATADEIANYDLSGSDPVAPQRPEKPAPPPPPASAPAREEAAKNLEIEEFIARTVEETPGGEKPAKIRRPFSLVEKVCFAAGGLVLVALSIWLGNAAVSAAGGGKAHSSPRPDLPIKGQLVTISDASAGWRKSVKDADRVEQIEVILPKPGHFEAGIIPELVFTIDSSASTNGYLRIIFRDSEDKARGDTRVVQFTNGKLGDPGSGGSVKNGTEGAIYCSSGLFDENSFRAYVAGNLPRWSIEIAESTSYNSADKDWKILGMFDVSNNLAQ